MAFSNPWDLKTKLVSFVEKKNRGEEKEKRRREEEEEEEEEEGRRSSKPKSRGMELWILYGSHGILKLVMVNSLFPKLGY